MAHTVLFTIIGPLPSQSELEAWLTEQGEPYESDEPQSIQLRALPMRLVFGTDGLRAEVSIHENVPLTRLVRLIFDLSLRLGGDVRLASVGSVSRTDLWVRFADEQDRHRIARAVARAADHPHREDLLTALWSLLCTLGHGQDLRWDPHLESIVEVRDIRRTREIVGDTDVEQDDPTPVGSISAPVQGELHMLAWRWLAEAYPSLVDR